MAKSSAKKLNITPLHDRVIVMPAAAELLAIVYLFN